MKFITEINSLSIDENTFVAAMPTNRSNQWKIYTPQGCFIVEILESQKKSFAKILVDKLKMKKGITRLATKEEEELDLDVRWEDGFESEVYYKEGLPIISYPDQKVIIVTENNEITIIA